MGGWKDEESKTGERERKEREGETKKTRRDQLGRV